MHARQLVLGTLALAALIHAGKTGAQVGPAADLAAGGALQMTGKILAIDTNGKVMRLEADSRAGGAIAGGIKQVLDMALTEETVITKAGAQAKPEDLKFGEQVQIAYDVEQGKNIARAVVVQEPGQAMPADSAAPQAGAVTEPAPPPAAPAQEPDRSATSGAQTPLSEERP